MGVLGDGDHGSRPKGGGRRLAPGEAALHGHSAEQRTPGSQERPHTGRVQLHANAHRPGPATLCSQRYFFLILIIFKGLLNAAFFFYKG